MVGAVSCWALPWVAGRGQLSHQPWAQRPLVLAYLLLRTLIKHDCLTLEVGGRELWIFFFMTKNTKDTISSNEQGRCRGRKMVLREAHGTATLQLLLTLAIITTRLRSVKGCDHKHFSWQKSFPGFIPQPFLWSKVPWFGLMAIANWRHKRISFSS